MDARDPWRLIDRDHEADPTVYVPYLVALERCPPMSAFTVWVGDRGVHVLTVREIPLEEVTTGHVDIRPVPPDWHETRARYRWAYQPWEAHEARILYQFAMDGLSIADIAEKLARPPEHVAVKLDRVRAIVGERGHAPPRYEFTSFGRDQPSMITDSVVTRHTRPDPTGRPWYDEDPEADPTVHVRFVLHLRERGSGPAMSEPVLGVGLNERYVSYRSASGGEGDVLLPDIALGRVEIRPVPADQEALRAAYPGAYRLWTPEDALSVLRSGRQESPMYRDGLIRDIARPPEHIATKQARLEALASAARSPGPRSAPAPHNRAPRRKEGEYIVSVLDVARPRDVADRVGAHDAKIMRQWFHAHLTDEQVAALRADPDVEYIEDNALGDFR
jgi:hypothetical protein